MKPTLSRFSVTPLVSISFFSYHILYLEVVNSEMLSEHPAMMVLAVTAVFLSMKYLKLCGCMFFVCLPWPRGQLRFSNVYTLLKFVI